MTSHPKYMMCSLMKDRQWELQQRAAQLTQLDMAMKDQSSESDQRLIRLETSLKKSRLDTEQRQQQVRQLEEKAAELMAALKEKMTEVECCIFLRLIGCLQVLLLNMRKLHICAQCCRALKLSVEVFKIY